jgi:4-amino-4-deoxy-L-arabinose transferase-like glycosyltransferase
MSEHHITGPVMAYLLIPSVLLGGSEIAAHFVSLVFLVIAAAGTARLALLTSLTRSQAGLAALLVVVSPAVLGMSATAMPDTTAMAFAVLGVERLMVWHRSGRLGAGIVCGILLAVATLTRPHLLLLLPLATLWLLQPGTPREPWSPRRMATVLMPVLLASILVFTANRLTVDPQSGRDSAHAILSASRAGPLWFNLSAYLVHWAVAFPLTILWAALRGPSFLRSQFAWIGAVVGIAVALAGGQAPLAGFIAATGAALADVLGDAWRRRDRLQGFLGLWLLLAAAAAPYQHLPAKFLVPSAPAMALLIARFEPDRLRRYRPLLTTLAVLGLLLGVFIIRADSELAEIGREGGKIAATELRRGMRVWVDGAWGFQWYGIKAGAEPLAFTPPVPQPGDLVVFGTQGRVLHSRYPARTLVQRHLFDEAGGRVMSEGAGFFSNGFGPLPWVWGTEQLGRIEVWRVDSAPAQ